MKWEMSATWRMIFWILGGSALFAIGYGIYGLAGGDVEDQPEEMVVAILVGILLIPFSWTGHRYSRFTLTPERMTYLGFGLWCTQRKIELSEIERFGVAEEKSRNGGTYTILLLELSDGRRTGIKIEMYRRHSEIPHELAKLLGQSPSPTKTTFVGAKFDDDPDEPVR